MLAGLAFLLALPGRRPATSWRRRYPLRGGADGVGPRRGMLHRIFPLIVGGQTFQSFVVDLSLPLFGEHHLVSSVLFDVGVYLVVIGLIVDVRAASFGDRCAQRRRAQELLGAGAPAIHAQTTVGVAR
ncbi:MnhB domain-containing protein [Garicola koreensis]